MFVFVSVLIIITAILLMLIVLVQNSKGGGLAANFQSSNQVMGVRRTTDFLEKATWVLASSLLVLSVMASGFIPKPTVDKSLIEDKIEQVVDPAAMPSFPTTVPTTAPVEENE